MYVSYSLLCFYELHSIECNFMFVINVVSEISITRCMVNPGLTGDICAPDTTREQDAIKGKWVRVDRNVNVEAGYMSGWLVGDASKCLLYTES